MTAEEIKQILEKQRTFFYTGSTLSVDYRLHALRRLKACILRHEAEINHALKEDLGKSPFESYMCETGLVLSELTYMIRHVRRFLRRKPSALPLPSFTPEALKSLLPMV